MRILLPAAFLALCLGGLPVLRAGESLTLVKKGRSSYSIYHGPQAPKSVQTAAQELQRAIEIAAGAKLPIVHAPASPMIALGQTEAAGAAGISMEKLSNDSFRIETRGPDIIIAGRDDPDSRITPHPGGARGDIRISRGTLLGTYAFLEDYLGVRWLLPGEWGEDIPRRETWRLPEIHRSEQPRFQTRQLWSIQETGSGHTGAPGIDEWISRQKLSGTLLLQTAHAWDPWDTGEPPYVLPETVRQHPEFMAANGARDKFCTSQEGLVAAFADGVLRWIEKHPYAPVISISPSDGGGFCRCERCAPLIEKDPHGDDSFSYLILKFYNDVARIVGRRYPDKLLCGFVYASYIYPPKRAIKIEPNIGLNMAAIDYYGFGLYKPAYLAEFVELVDAWSRLTKHFSYSSYTVWLEGINVGTPVPPSIQLMKLELPTLADAGTEGVIVRGTHAWGHGAPVNYLHARLMWDTRVDVEKTFQEWLARAYGPGWRSMEALLTQLDGAIRGYKLRGSLRERNYEVTYEFIRDVYVPQFAQMERHYAETLRQTQTEPQRKRLAMFGDNLVQLHYNLRRAGLLKNTTGSIFYRSDEDYAKFAAEPARRIALTDHPKAIWAPEKRKLGITRLAAAIRPPVIDGDLSDEAWKAAAVADEFRVTGARIAATGSTTVRAIYDADNLFLAFECQAKAGRHPAGKCRTRDDMKIYHEDSLVEIFFCDTPDTGRWWHLTLNCLNTQVDGLNDRTAYNLDWKSAVKIADQAWTAEIIVPWASLNRKCPAAGESWRGNFAREEPSIRREASSWNGVEAVFAVPDQFGEWIFEK